MLGKDRFFYCFKKTVSLLVVKMFVIPAVAFKNKLVFFNNHQFDFAVFRIEPSIVAKDHGGEPRV